MDVRSPTYINETDITILSYIVSQFCPYDPYDTGHISINNFPKGGSQCPNLGTSLQGAGAERTCLISAIRGDTCASFQHITAYTCCHGPAPCGAAVKEAQNRDPGLRVESFNTTKSAVFVSPFVFSGHSFTAKKLRKKKVVESPMSQNKGFLWSFRFGSIFQDLRP